MKVKASIKKRGPNDQIVRRKGKLYAVSYTHLTLPTKGGG